MTDLKKTTPGPSKRVVVTKDSEQPGSKLLKTDPIGEATHQRRYPVVDVDALVLDENVEIVNRVNAKIRWNQSVAGDEKFEICYWTDEADKKYDYTNSSNHMITKLKTGSTYSVKVTRVNIDGRQVSATSNVIHFITGPAQPIALRVENDDSSPHDSIIVYFNDPNEHREVTHEVLVETLNTKKDTIRETTTNRKVFVGGLIPGVSYSVAVVTIDGDLRSQPAYYDSLVTTYPAIPQDVELVHQNGKLTLTWQALAVKPLHYEVQWEANGVETISKVSEEIFTLDELMRSADYTFRVTAVNKAGRSYLSEKKSYQTALAPPSNIIVSNLPSYPERGILATWDQCDGALRYDIDIIDVKNNKTVDARTAEKCSHEILRSLEPGQEYRVEIRAVASDGERHSRIEYSKSIWTYCAQVPWSEAKLVSPSTVDIGWDRSRGAEGYKVICKSNNGSIIEKTVATNQLTLPNLDLGEIFKVTVMPGNQAGYGKESNPLEFRTGFAAVTDVEVTVLSSDSVKIKFAAPQNKPPAYSVLVVQTSDDEELQLKLIKRDHCVITDLKPGIEHVVYVWSTDPKARYLDSEKTSSKHFFTAPSKVARVEVIKDSPTSRHIVWDSTAGTSSYVVKVKKAGVPAKSMPPTKRTGFHVDKLDLHSKYFVTVMAQNDGGEGAESDEVCFETELHPPKSIKVTNDLSNPTMGLSVRVEETDIPSSHYQLRIISLNGRRDEFVKITRQEAMSVKTLGGMTPGDSYQLAICSLHDSDESLNSREKFSSVIQTNPAIPQDVELVHQNGKLTLTWQALAVKPSHYQVQWEANGQWIRETISKVSEETFTLDELMRSTDYTFRVAAVNKAGRSYLSEKKSYQTAPPTPVGLDAKILSTREIQAFCDDTYGASTYVFKIDGREHKTDQPTFTLHHSQLNKHIQIQVFAENKGGRSPPSSICECRQVLLQLQEKFLEKAKNFQDCKFITPKFKEVLSGNEAIDFGTEEFCVGKGKTVCVVGRDFSGKTSCCFQYLRSLSEHELGIYLDWDDYKDLKASLDIKSTLMRQMKDFGEIEKKFAIEWMRAHPDQVVFVVDNLVLPHSVAGKLKLWEDIATPQEIFYSLVIPTREIFPECQVLCATSQSDLRQIIKPNRTMAIIGFDEKHIKEMRGMILGEDCDIMLPTHLEYFCKNPAYCKIIFRLLKNPDANVDMESYSSILLKLISESVSCYPEGKMKEKLRHLKDEVKNVPQKLRITKVDPSKVKKRTKLKSESATTHRSLTNASEVPSFIEILEENWQRNHSCEALHDYIIKAIFFGLFCPLNEFKNRFHKKSIKLGVNANIWTLAAGLLREETVNLAADLFSAIDEKLNVKEIAKKLDFTKTFAQNNLERIHKQVLSDPVIALDWLNIINEIKGLDIIPKSKWKVSARNYHTPDEIEQMASFLRQVRGMFFSHLRVKLEKDLSPEKRLSIETALRENPYGEVRVSNSKPGINLTRNSPLLSFRSKSRGPSPKPASVTSSLDNSAGDTGGVFTETPDSYGNMYASLPYIPQTSQTSQFYQGRSFRSLRSAGTENLHGTSIGKEFKTDNISLTPNPETVDPEPVEFVGQAGCSEQVNQPFSSEFIKVSHIFTVKTLKESESIKRSYVSVPTYCTSHTSGTPAKLMQFTGQKWKAVDDVVIVGQVACFNAIANEIYALGLDTSSIQDTIWYHLVCRTNFSGEKNLEIKISGDDRLSHIKTTDLGATEQRFVGEIGDEFNIKITSGSSVISDWRFSIRSQFEGVDKSVAVDWEAKMNSDNNVVCTIYKDETIVSQARFQNPPNNDRLPETSLYLQLLISKKATDQCLKYVAQSHASGKKLSTVSSKNDVILEGIDPGDKYTVYVYDGDELNGTCIGRFEIQTSKYIANCGGTMTVGTINLHFPEGAIHNQALVEVSSIVENPPDPPDGSVFVAPPMDFRSTQKKFAKHVTCKLMFPYITVHKSIEVDILCFENYEWQKVCSRQLTETKTLEFKCDHFTLYAVVTQMPYSVVKQIPLSYELCSYIYHDENDNFTGVTCLNHPRISHECHQLLSQSRYVQTPHLISPKEWQRLNGDATRYTLKCCDPDHTIGEWEVTLNQQFVQNGWRDLTELNNMVARLDNVLEIELMFKRNYGNNEKEWKRKVKYPLERNIKDPPPDMSGVNVFHNGKNFIKMGNVLVRPDN